MRLGKLEIRKLREIERLGGEHHSGMLGRVWAELHRHGYVESVDKRVTVKVMRLTAKGAQALRDQP